jgi:RNA polymerase sigma factor (sigma-70 family)
MAVTLDAVMVGGGAVDSGSHEPGSGAPAVEGRPVEPAPVDGRSALPRQVEPDDAATAPWTPPSWEQVVREHSGRVYRLAYRLTGNVHDAEDLTQEVFVRVFRSLSSYTPGTFEGWLHRITTNLFLDGVRRKKRVRFDPLADDAHDRVPGREPDPSRVYEDTHLDDDVQAALDALSPDFRAAVVLCDIEGLSYEEVAATLGIKLGTVRSRIHRGRSQLRTALAHRRRPDRPVGLTAGGAADGLPEEADGPGRVER